MIDLWVTRTDVGVVPRDALAWLDADEQARLGRIRGGEEKRGYLLGRLAARSILARALDKPPAELRFVVDEERGKPRLAWEGLPDFNLSRAEGAIAVALAREGEVGVDIERLDLARTLEFDAFLTADEQRQLPTVEPERTRAALRIWTRKEAYAKLLGRGLETDPIDIRLPADDGDFRLEYQEIRLGEAEYGVAIAWRSRDRTARPPQPSR